MQMLDQQSTLSAPLDGELTAADEAEIETAIDERINRQFADERLDLVLSAIRAHRGLFMAETLQRCCEREGDEERGERMADNDFDGLS